MFHWLLLLLLSHFSCVQLCVTPLMAAHQAPHVPGILQGITLEWVAISMFKFCMIKKIQTVGKINSGKLYPCNKGCMHAYMLSRFTHV